MDLAAARAQIATVSGVHGVARPPGNLSKFPAMIVGDPIQINYHQAKATRTEVLLPIRVIVSRSAEQDTTAAMDTLVSYGQLPAALEALDPDDTYSELVVESLSGGYADFAQDGRIVGISADLTARIIFTT